MQGAVKTYAILIESRDPKDSRFPIVVPAESNSPRSAAVRAIAFIHLLMTEFDAEATMYCENYTPNSESMVYGYGGTWASFAAGGA